jgi:hypothetical protein
VRAVTARHCLGCDRRFKSMLMTASLSLSIPA